MTPHPAPVGGCGAVHVLCDILPEAQAMFSLLASHAQVPADIRARCGAMHYRLRDAIGDDAEGIRS